MSTVGYVVIISILVGLLSFIVVGCSNVMLYGFPIEQTGVVIFEGSVIKDDLTGRAAYENNIKSFTLRSRSGNGDYSSLNNIGPYSVMVVPFGEYDLISISYGAYEYSNMHWNEITTEYELPDDISGQHPVTVVLVKPNQIVYMGNLTLYMKNILTTRLGEDSAYMEQDSRYVFGQSEYADKEAVDTAIEILGEDSAEWAEHSEFFGYKQG